MERGNISNRESEICDTLLEVKKEADDKVLRNTNLLNNEGYFTSMMLQMVIGNFNKGKIPLNPDAAKYINGCLVKEYMNEYQGKYAW